MTQTYRNALPRFNGLAAALACIGFALAAPSSALAHEHSVAAAQSNPQPRAQTEAHHHAGSTSHSRNPGALADASARADHAASDSGDGDTNFTARTGGRRDESATDAIKTLGEQLEDAFDADIEAAAKLQNAKAARDAAFAAAASKVRAEAAEVDLAAARTKNAPPDYSYGDNFLTIDPNVKYHPVDAPTVTYNPGETLLIFGTSTPGDARDPAHRNKGRTHSVVPPPSPPPALAPDPSIDYDPGGTIGPGGASGGGDAQ